MKTEKNIEKQENECIKINVTVKEALMIAVIRRYNYGSFKIHKFNNEPIRVELESSLMLKDENINKALKELHKFNQKMNNVVKST